MINLKQSENSRRARKVVILDNIRSVHNVGSIFRTSDALGVNKIYLCGTTPTPIDRFGRARKDLAKVALGAQIDIVWEYCSDIKEIIKKLKKEKFQIIAVEQDKKSVDFKKIKAKYPMAIVMGNEVGGIDKKILSLCDTIAEIPMVGNKESLNVSVSFGIAGYQMLGGRK
jgi:tRNA G18 (ribose-2'-O)-methylase SpoU